MEILLAASDTPRLPIGRTSVGGKSPKVRAFTILEGPLATRAILLLQNRHALQTPPRYDHCF